MKPILFSIISFCLFFTSCNQTNDKVVLNYRSILDSLIKQSNLVLVKERPVISTLDLSGKISTDENRSPRICSLTSGIVLKVLVELGDHVTKGQLLATIKSPELLDAQREYKNAEVELLNHEKNVDAAKYLAETGLISEKEFVITQNKLQIAKNNLQKSKELLSIYNQGSNPDEFNIYAPITGYIIEKNISTNSQFQSGQSQSLFTVSDLNEMYADAHVYETDINKVHLNDSVYITTLAYPDTVFKGTISKIIDVLNPQTKTMCVRVKLKNNTYLKPEMYVQMSINCLSKQIMKAVPKSAVVFDNSLNYVVIQQGDSAVARKIQIQSTNNIYSYFEGDVKPDEKVSTKDVLMIYNAINN